MPQQEADDNTAHPAPQPWSAHPAAQQRLAASLGNARPILLCDYDGTLAPFHEDKMQAAPYPGVAERLERIAAGPTQLAFISGRQTRELLQLLPLAARCEVWGMHGRERYTPADGIVRFEPTAAQRTALDTAERTLAAQGYAAALERKVGSIALHWRSAAALPPGTGAEQAREAARQAFAPHDRREALALLPFDGGLELRTGDRTKAHAAEAILEGNDARAAIFLGDDLTDEDAFEVLRARGGMGLLVREDSRPSRASYLLRPPAELLAFFDWWLQQVPSARDVN